MSQFNRILFCYLWYFLHSIRYKGFPSFSSVGYPIQYHLAIHPNSNRNNWQIFSAWHKFFTRFALTSSNLAILVFLFAILDFDVNNPITLPVPYSITAMVAVAHALLLAWANVWRWTAFTFLISYIRFLGTLTFRIWLVHLIQSFLTDGETSLFHSLPPSHTSMYMCFPSATGLWHQPQYA